MKKMLWLCAVAAMMCGCGSNGEKIEGVDMTFGRYELHDSCASGVEGIEAQCKVDYSIPFVLDDTEAGRKINEGVLGCEFGICDAPLEVEAEAYARYLMDSYKKDVESAVDGMTKDEIDNETWNSFNYAYMQEGKFVKGKGHVLCYQSGSYVYTGGAHGVSETRVMNFDVRTGEYLYEVFNSDFESSVRTYLLEQLIDDLGMDVMETGISELRTLGYTFKDEMPMTRNFLLAENGVVFIYPVYSIASYAQGEQRITLSYEILADCMTDKAKDVLGLSVIR